MTSKIAESFVQEFVLGFGLLSGLWIHVGINPETEIIKAFSDIVNTLSPNSGFSFIFWLIPIISLIVSLLSTYFIGGKLGLVAVGCAFIGGIFIDSTIGVLLLIVGIILGFIAPQLREEQYF